MNVRDLVERLQSILYIFSHLNTNTRHIYTTFCINVISYALSDEDERFESTST